jgi:hypothetical protein
MAAKVHIPRLLKVLSFLLSSNNSFPQYYDIKFELITVKGVSSENKVNCIFQDHLGFIKYSSEKMSHQN